MNLIALKPLAFSLALAIVATMWVTKYCVVRQDRKYSEGRKPIEKDEPFRVMGMTIFVLFNVITLSSFWTNSSLLLLLFPDDRLRIAGLVVLIAATLLYIKSMNSLGVNYSPFFDSYLPNEIVTRGPYRYIRHPIYLANILLYLGYVLTSGSVWVIGLGGYGVLKMMKALMKEEFYLSETFPEYDEYRAKTSRLVPFIY